MNFPEYKVMPCALSSMNTGCESTSVGEAQDSRCADADYRVEHPDECPDDPQCSDPSFALAHPELCLNAAKLIIKPEIATVEMRRSTQFRAFLWRDGHETEVSARFYVGNTGVAVIGGVSGNATGVAEGIATVTARFGVFTALAQLSVVSNCSSRTNTFALIMDVSKSMSVIFSDDGGSRLSYAKSVATKFIDCLLDKDRFGVFKFDANAQQVTSFNISKETTKSAINSLRTTSGSLTNIADGLLSAKAAFDAESIPEWSRVYVLFTDGENKAGANPVQLATELKESGAIIIVVGLRSYSTWFRQLEHIASGGFFINATSRNEDSIPDMLNGLKSSICSGRCGESAEFSGTLPALNFTDFQKWSVVAGTVDLIGQGGGASMFDLLPGNGLYVDLCGSSGNSDDLGMIESDPLSLVEGETYTLTYRLAGNQREERGDDVVRVSILADGNEFANTEHLISSFDDFEEFSFSFAGHIGTVHAIRIQQRSIGEGGESVFGCLLDSVSLVKVSDGSVVFSDSFDGENLTFFPKRCGESTATEDGIKNINCNDPMVTCSEDDGVWRFNGYDCQSGCGCSVDTTPAQIPDESPVGDVEGGPTINPAIYTSTRTYTAVCASGYTGSSVTKPATATSEISQEDADEKALALARLYAEQAIECVAPFDVGDIINIRLWPNAPQNGATAAQIASDRKTGYAAFGNSTEDFWNQTGNEANDPSQSGIHRKLYKANAELCGVTFRNITNTPITYERMEHADPVMRWFGRMNVGASYRFKLVGLPAGMYSVAIFGRGPNAGENGKFFVQTEGYDHEVTTLLDTDDWKEPALIPGVHYALYVGVLVEAGNGIYIHALQNDSELSLLGAIQIKRVV